MNQRHDPNRTVDVPPSAPADSLDAGLAAGFGPPRSGLGDMRPVLLREAQGESDHVVRPRSDAMPTREEAGDRYRLDGEIARGGMGAVLRGRDMDLGRDLAVKVLLEQHAGRPEVARRFVEEAQIGGQLQHPGVVPVYDIGRFGDRPFFTMKLVKGHTLAALLAERAGPSADRPRLLGIALQVAQTLAYAHARGVIHRDLKPANVMVGAFGEVQVMDWGLAKVLAEGGVADELRAGRQHQAEGGTLIRTARSGDGSAGTFGTETEAGSLLGTPAYMPPEQANGDVASLDRRCDVFGLGALLCEILTGRPPYVGRSNEEVRRKAANGDLADAAARLDACGADAELVALARACLSPEAADRPRDAREVADGLSAYLEGVQERLQEARRERAVAQAREAEQRKRRRVHLALAAALVVLLAGGGAFASWRDRQAQAGRERDARNAEAVAALLDQAEEALKAGDAAKAAVALGAAGRRSAEGGAEAEAGRLGRLDADLKLLRDLDAIDQFRWTKIDNKFPDAAAVATRTREALARFGADIDSGEGSARASASAVRERIVSALDRLLRQEKTAGVRALLRRVDAHPYRDAIRDAVLAEEQAKVAELAGQKAALEQPPGFTAFLGESKVIDVQRRRRLLQAALNQRSGDLGLLMTLGGTYDDADGAGVSERLRWYQAATAAAPDNSAALNNLGCVLCDGKRDYDGAIACFRRVMEIDPKNGRARYNLGNALTGKGELDEAIPWYEKALALDPGRADTHVNLGHALSRKGEWAAAVASYKKAIEIDPTFLPAHNGLGAFLCDVKRDYDGAAACFRKAIALDPNDAKSHVNLGNALAPKNDVDGAAACFRKAIALDPKLAQAHYSLGVILHRKEKGDEAIACWQKTVELDPDYALAHLSLGHALGTKGRFAESLAAFERAHELAPKQPNWRYPTAEWVRRARAKVAVEGKLSAFREGKFRPSDNKERLGLAGICHAKMLHYEATGLYADAFAADPKLADDLGAGHRYNAACYASLAASGQGEGAAKLDDKERTRLRGQALGWLRADLALHTRRLEAGPPADRAVVQRTLLHWQKYADLAGIRDTVVLQKLSAEERRACETLWSDVAALLKKAEGNTK